MVRLLTLLLALAASSASSAERSEPPSRTARYRAMAAYERSVVRVRSGRQAGLGIIVGANGQVLTAVQHVGSDSTHIETEGKRLPARVVLADTTSKVALVVGPSGSWPSVPVHVSAEDLMRQWLLAVLPGRGRLPPQAYPLRARKGPAPFLDLGLPLAPGSPVFDTQGRLVALVVERRGARSRALPLGAVQRQLTQLGPGGTP